MSIENSLKKLKIAAETQNLIYEYIDVFKNPSKLPINQIHIERVWRELRKEPKDLDFLKCSSKELEAAYFDKKTEIIPALDKRWLPKTIIPKFEPFSVFHGQEEKDYFLSKNIQYLEGLNYLLNCNYHQFWCTILFEPAAAVALKSFLLNPVLPFQESYLEGEYFSVYNVIINSFLLVYERLITFKQSEIEYMPNSFGLQKIIDLKLLSLPIVITLAVLYKERNIEFVNRMVELYFNESTDIGFIIKEVELIIEQNLTVLEMLGGHICGFDESAVVVPIELDDRPAVFSLPWVYSAVNYLLTTVLVTNTLFHFYKPGVEMALNQNLPYRLPFIYVKVYQELYELLDKREEVHTQKELFKKVIDEINMGRAEFVEMFHTFISYCLDEALKHMGNAAKQEHNVEIYIKLLTTALEDEYFICDYNIVHSVATQNEMFESCCDIDPTRTEFIMTCINKLPRNKTLQELSKLKRQTIESVFRDFVPPEPEQPEVVSEPQPGSSGLSASAGPSENDVDDKIRFILDMFPHLGDGYILQCLQAYNYNSTDVINAILENNLPPHLSEIPFDSIRIPPEPEPEKPILAYRGKKPEYDDALKLLNDKEDVKKIKNLVLEGIQYNYGDVYDDEYDDRDEEDEYVPVTDNPIEEELKTFNPNRPAKGRRPESEDEEESEEENVAAGPSRDRNRLNFCEDPAVLRERREAKFRGGKHPPSASSNNAKTKADVVGKPKGQGQDKSTLISRQRKNANKSSRANHNRKGGAQFKRNKGMIPS